MAIDIYKSLFENLSFGVAIVDNSNQIIESNNLFNIYFKFNHSVKPLKLDHLHSSFKNVPISSFKEKTKLTLSDGKVLSVHASPFKDGSWIIEVLDISLQEIENEDFYIRANYDQLTHLPNRQLFNDRCKQALSAAHRHKENLALFFIDVDDFKSINDTYGHEAGDSVLLETAKRLTASVRESDTVSRWAGDEFSILLPKIGAKENIKQLLNRLLESFSEPQQAQDIQIPVSLSLGISLAPQMGTNFEELMRFADKAMYEAKNTTGFCYKYYSE